VVVRDVGVGARVVVCTINGNGGSRMSEHWDADEPAAEAEPPPVGGIFEPGAPPRRCRLLLWIPGPTEWGGGATVCARAAVGGRGGGQACVRPCRAAVEWKLGPGRRGVGGS
jgi:hypothetical protein